MQKVLVIRLSALGDVLFTVPAVQALQRARPGVQVDWVVEDRAATLLDLVPGLHRRIVYSRRAWVEKLRAPWRWPAAARQGLEHLQGLRLSAYDAVLDFQGNLKSGLHMLASRGHDKLGFDREHNKEYNHWFSRRQVQPGAEIVHRVDKALSLVRGLIPELPATLEPPRLEIPEPSHEFACQALLEVGLKPEDEFLVLHPGSSGFGAFKRWPADRFAHLGDQLAKRRQARVLITWGPGEQDLAQSVANSMKSGAGRVSPATRTLADLAALVARARLMVGSDSAPLHLAAFLGTPVVALFGPKDPRIYGPRFAPVEVVHTYLHCSPCTRRRCPDALCMAEISVSQVLAAAERLLSRRVGA